MHSEINQMSIKFQSRSNNEAFARQAVAAFAAQLDPTIEEINDIKTAVSEAVTNCIVHAYPDRVGKIYIYAAVYEDNTVKISRLLYEIRAVALRIFSRRASRCLPPATQGAPAWVLPLWRALWIACACARVKGLEHRSQ